MKEYLSEEEQYKKSINNEEINRIEDFKLRSIRYKYWNMKRTALVDEINIPDSEIEKVLNKIDEEECIELKKYRENKEKEKGNLLWLT